MQRVSIGETLACFAIVANVVQDSGCCAKTFGHTVVVVAPRIKECAHCDPGGGA